MSRRASPQQLAMLKGLAEGRSWDWHLRGRSEHGGGTGTLYSLIRRGWVDQRTENLTPEGRDYLTSLGITSTSDDTAHEH